MHPGIVWDGFVLQAAIGTSLLFAAEAEAQSSCMQQIRAAVSSAGGGVVVVDMDAPQCPGSVVTSEQQQWPAD